MEKQKKKLTISGKPKKIFVAKQNFENKKRTSFQDKKFSKPLNKTPNSFKKTFGQFPRLKKMKMDHRYQAFKKLKRKVKTL